MEETIGITEPACSTGRRPPVLFASGRNWAGASEHERWAE
jgi:hypothetical protein